MRQARWPPGEQGACRGGDGVVLPVSSNPVFTICEYSSQCPGRTDSWVATLSVPASSGTACERGYPRRRRSTELVSELGAPGNHGQTRGGVRHADRIRAGFERRLGSALSHGPNHRDRPHVSLTATCQRRSWRAEQARHRDRRPGAAPATGSQRPSRAGAPSCPPFTPSLLALGQPHASQDGGEWHGCNISAGPSSTDARGPTPAGR
jgi:hypothetical protein